VQDKRSTTPETQSRKSNKQIRKAVRVPSRSERAEIQRSDDESAHVVARSVSRYDADPQEGRYSSAGLNRRSPVTQKDEEKD
jgi:hypothetical protein